MASGNTLFAIPASSFEAVSSGTPSLTERNKHKVIALDGAATEGVIYRGTLPAHYGAGGITVKLRWYGASATTGDVKWSVSFERMNVGGLDVDADSFASAKTATTTTSGTSGVATETSIAFSNGAEISSLAAGEDFRLKVERLGADAADTMNATDAQLVTVILTET